MALAAVAICIGLIVLAIWGIVSLWGVGSPVKSAFVRIAAQIVGRERRERVS